MTTSSPPVVGPALAWRFPTAAESVLDNGMRVLVFPCPGQYVVSASLLIDVPLSAEPRALEGVAGLVARCLTRGAGELSPDDFADALAACGADVAAAANPDAFAVRLSVPASHLARGLELMAMAVRSPTFAAKEVAQERRLRLQEIDLAAAYPGSVTVEKLNQALFGDFRAARPAGGTPQSVVGLSRDDVVAYADRHLQPTSAVLILAGDFDGTNPVDAAAAAFADWTHEGGPVVDAEVPTVSESPRLLLVDWPDAPQATVRVGAPGITRGDPRWPALFVANYVVGGSFGSRLNTVLREQKGFTYGVSSSLDGGRRVGLLGVGASVQSTATAEAVGDILSILEQARNSLQPDEVAVAVRAATDSAAMGFERAEAVVGRVEMLISQRLPLDHVDLNLARIRAVTADEANAAYDVVVHPQGSTVVIAGDATALTESLRSLGHAPVEVLSRS